MSSTGSAADFLPAADVTPFCAEARSPQHWAGVLIRFRHTSARLQSVTKVSSCTSPPVWRRPRLDTALGYPSVPRVSGTGKCELPMYLRNVTSHGKPPLTTGSRARPGGVDVLHASSTAGPCVGASRLNTVPVTRHYTEFPALVVRKLQGVSPKYDFPQGNSCLRPGAVLDRGLLTSCMPLH